MSNKFMFFSVLFFSFSLWSQNTTFEIKSSNLIFFNANPSDEATNKIEGSQYINKQFLPSTFSCLSESTPPIRYNVFKEEMEFILDNQLYYVKKSDTCIITLSNNSYQYFKNYDKEKNSGYLMILNKSNNPKYILYKKEKVKFIPEYIPNSSYGEAKPAKYVIDKSRYFITIQDSIVEFPNKKSELLKLFPNYKEKIELYLKEKKISFSEESSLLELIQFINAL